MHRIIIQHRVFTNPKTVFLFKKDELFYVYRITLITVLALIYLIIPAIVFFFFVSPLFNFPPSAENRNLFEVFYYFFFHQVAIQIIFSILALPLFPLALLLPAAAIGEKISISEVHASAKGNRWRIAVVILASSIPSLIASFIAIALNTAVTNPAFEALESVRKVHAFKQIFLIIRRIDAKRRKARAVLLWFSKSLARRRHL
ncbi:MAG: hypothetical protein ACJAU6_003196, partial [Alphaproteobacteria bacterium]